MKKYAYKLIGISRTILALTVLSFVIFAFSFTLYSRAEFTAAYAVTFISCLSGMTGALVYYIKFREISACIKKLEKEKIEYYMDDVKLESPELKISKIYCGTDVFFVKMPYMVIRYSEVAWIQRTKHSGLKKADGEYRIYLKDGKSFLIKCNATELSFLINRYILVKNPGFINNLSDEKKKDYFTINPEASARNKRKYTMLSALLVGIGSFFLTVTLIKKTYNTTNLIINSLMIIAGVFLLFYKNNFLDFKDFTSNILLKIRKSYCINLIFKIATVTNGLSFAAIIILALANVKAVDFIIIPYLISLVPFMASTFLKVGFFVDKKYRNFNLPEEETNDYSLITEYTANFDNALCVYSFMTSFGMDWEYIISSVEHILKSDITGNITLKVKNIVETDITKDFLNNGKDIRKTLDIRNPQKLVFLSGKSKRLKLPVNVIWFSDKRLLRILIPLENREVVERYAETILRKSFNTEDSMKKGKRIPEELIAPVTSNAQSILFNVDLLIKLKNSPVAMPQYEYKFVIPLTQRTPVISIYEDIDKTAEYCLQTDESEDFTGKFFHCSVRVDMRKPLLAALIEGFISDTAEKRDFTLNNIGYRMEVYLFRYNPNQFKLLNAQIKGNDLAEKALKYPGFTTPSNVRLIGICQKCQKSFAFHAYAFYMAQQDVAYSDNGQVCCTISGPDINPETWSYSVDGLNFSYYNSFCCPNCGEAYIDYKHNREMKNFGVSGCVHLGQKYYNAE